MQGFTAWLAKPRPAPRARLRASVYPKAVVCRVHIRGGASARPRYPLTVFHMVGGVNVLLQSTPRRSTPRRRSAPPPEGEAPGGFPLGLLLAGVRKER